MPFIPEPLRSLTVAFGGLPGIGPRSAERLALHVIQAEPGFAKHLAETLLTARERVQLCERCGGLCETQPCGLCGDHRRDASVLCVVEQPVDIFAIEKTGVFRGRFHVLGGKLSPINGIEPEDLRFDELDQRLAAEPIEEIVLALPTDVEGDATSFYLAQRLSASKVSITRLAHGLPAGAGLEYADELTLSRAFEGRQPLRQTPEHLPAPTP